MKRLACGALLALLACGGGDTTPDGNEHPDGGATTDPDGGAPLILMDPEERALAASAAFSEMQVLSSQGLPRDQVAAQMVAFFLSNPAFATAGYSPEFDNVWATFKDGVPFVIFDNQPPNPDVVPDPVEKPQGAFDKPQGDTVPKDKQYRILRTLGNAYSSNESATRVLLNKSGYKAAARNSDLVEHLMTDVAGDGFFMWATHAGGYAYVGDTTALQFGLSTRTTATAANETQEPYKSLLADGEIGIGWAGTDFATPAELESANETGQIDATTGVDLKYKVLNRRVYFLNPKFVRNRFKFTGNSVVIMNACTSLDPGLLGAFEKAGAAAYLGWDNPTSRGGPISFIAIDRMIGGSSAPPIPMPDERPFDIVKVFQWMVANGLNSYSDPPRTVTFTYKLLREPYGLLAPSIQSISIIESPFKDHKAQIVVSGIFGTKDETLFPRELLVSGVPQTIVGGDRDTIEAELDSTGPGSFGETVVKVGGRVSNIVPITAWNVPVKVEATTSGTGKFTVNMSITIRADVHKFRDRPGGPPDGTEPNGVQAAILMPDSNASWTAGGTYTEGCTHTLSGSGSATLPTSGVLSEKFLMGLGIVDRDAFEIQVTAILLAGQFGHDAITCPEPAAAEFPIAIPPSMVFKLNRDTFQIEPGEATLPAPPFNIKATWDTVLPFFPPTSRTPS